MKSIPMTIRNYWIERTQGIISNKEEKITNATSLDRQAMLDEVEGQLILDLTLHEHLDTLLDAEEAYNGALRTVGEILSGSGLVHHTPYGTVVGINQGDVKSHGKAIGLIRDATKEKAKEKWLAESEEGQEVAALRDLRLQVSDVIMSVVDSDLIGQGIRKLLASVGEEQSISLLTEHANSNGLERA